MTVRPDIRASATGPAPLAVQVVRQYAPSRGGLEDVVANLARHLQRRGYRVRIVTLDRVFTAPDRTLPDRDVVDGVEVVRIPFSGSTRYPLAPSVFRHIRDADLVHVHAIDFFFDALALAKPFHRKPMVATTHGGFFHTPKYARIKSVWFNTLTRFSASRYERVIGCSAQDARRFRQIADDRVAMIENGVDTEKFSDAGSPVARKRLATIGRFSVNKRLDKLLDAMVPLTRFDPDWHLDIIGVPGEITADDLGRLIAARGLSDKVAMHIGASEAEIRNILSACSFFASASDYEGFGLVAIEAMSAGLMPLLNPNTAYRDLADKHGEIRLCDFSRADHAAKAIEDAFVSLSNDVAGYRQSAMRAADGYAWEQVAAHYADIYRQVLGVRSPASLPAI